MSKQLTRSEKQTVRAYVLERDSGESRWSV